MWSEKGVHVCHHLRIKIDLEDWKVTIIGYYLTILILLYLNDVCLLSGFSFSVSMASISKQMYQRTYTWMLFFILIL